jgi:hypothetical protein
MLQTLQWVCAREMALMTPIEPVDAAELTPLEIVRYSLVPFDW